MINRLGFGLVLASVVALVSCGDDGLVWDYKPDDFLERIRSKRTDFLLHINYDDVDPEEVFQLHPGAPLYLAEVFADLGLFSVYRTLLMLQLREATEPYARYAARALTEHLIEGRQYSRVLDLADELLEAYGDDRQVRGNISAAAFAIGDYSGAAEYATALEDGDKRRLYWAAAESVEQGPAREEATEQDSQDAGSPSTVASNGTAIRDLLWASAVSDVHRVFADLLLVLNPRRPVLSPDQSRLLTAKLLIMDGLSAEAVDPLAEAIVSSRDEWGRGDVTGVVFDYFVAAARADRRVESAELLIETADVVEAASPDAAFAALEYAGRTLRAAGLLSAATPVLARARDLAPSAADKDRVLRYWFDTVARRPDADHVAAMYALYGATDSPENFDDLVSRLLHSKIHRREWRSLSEVGRIVIDSGAPAVRSEAAFLLAEAVRGEHVDGDATVLYKTAVSAGLAAPYAAILAAARLGTSPELLAISADAEEGAAGEQSSDTGAGGDEGAVGDDKTVGAREETGAGEQTIGAATDFATGESGLDTNLRVEHPDDRILDGYLYFAQLDAAYAFSRSANLSPAALLRLAERLSDRGDVTKSMRTADIIPTDRLSRHSKSVTLLRYPQAFVSSLAPVAEEHAIDESVFFGLVRDESYFDPAVESWAGAIGLSQLMPATAADVARRLRIELPDLTDPATNLAIGGHYFGDLVERFGSYAMATAAYNAGMGRLRSWIREAADLDAVLFVEWMPFVETRGHVKTVLVSAVFYSYLYANREAAETVNLYFPGTVSP